MDRLDQRWAARLKILIPRAADQFFYLPLRSKRQPYDHDRSLHPAKPRLFSLICRPFPSALPDVHFPMIGLIDTDLIRPQASLAFSPSHTSQQRFEICSNV